MRKVTLRRLEVFVAVVDEGSFAAAADRLGIAQPSVSAHIQALEQEIGGLVFERRRGRTPLLTELGRSVLDHARELIAEAADLAADIVNVRSAKGRRVVFSCQRSLANFVLKKDLTEFALTHPEIQLVIRIGKQEDVVTEVRDGVADVGCFLSNDEIRGLTSEVVGRQRLLLVAAPHHPLARRRRVKPAEVERYGFVTPPPSSLFGRAVSKLLAGVGIRNVTAVAQATEYQFLRELIAAGVGISCSPEKSVEADLNQGFLAAIDLDAPELVFDVRQIVSPRRPQSEAVATLMQFLRERRRFDVGACEGFPAARSAQGHGRHPATARARR